MRRVLMGSVALLFLTAAPAAADDDVIHNNYGSAGLIDMPSARMAPDGDLSIGAFFTKNTQRYNFGFQVLPWLEVDFRYTGLRNFDPLFPVYYDRSFGLKARLWEEGDILPSVALGINDLVGTGAYAGEYLVLSKHFGTVDASLGMGWGRFGSTALLRNPLSLISSSFDRRPGQFAVSTDPGATNFNSLFRGRNVGLFGGLSWATPVEGLTLIGEYSSDAYSLERSRGTFQPENQFNLGASYRLTDSLSLSVGWMYGESLSGNLSFDLDPVHAAYPQRIGPPPPEPRIRSVEEQQAALDVLTRVRSQYVGGADIHSRAFLANGELVDRLWQQLKPADAAIQGHTLSVVLTQGDPAAVCRDASRFVGQYTTTITTVHVARAGRTAQCDVASTPALALINIAPRSAPSLLTLANFTAPPILIDASKRSAATDAAALAKVRADAAVQSIAIAAMAFDRSDMIVYYSNAHYFSEAEAIKRLTRLLMQDAPAEIERFRLISTAGGEPIREFDVLRAPAERAFEQAGDLPFADIVSAGPAPMSNSVLMAAASKIYPALSWSIFPQFRQQLFDPQNPFGVQFLAGLDASVAVLPGLSINGGAEFSLFDTFTTNRPDESVLPHVRTDFIKYFTQGKNGISYLDAEYDFRLAPNVFATLRGGYLESMFAGVGGEVLWRPEGQRWAIGLDGFEVQQRDFDRLFGLQSYHAFTGHVSLYYASPFYNLDFAIHAGQYLAKDRGITFEVTRRFATGVEIGAFFTRTNVSAQQFGEGSFDKGIIIRIPVGWIAPIDTQSQLGLDLRPVQRDGGQRLAGDTSLYYKTLRQSEEEIERLQGN